MDVLPYLGSGALAVLVVVISYLLRWITVERQDCRKAIAELQGRLEEAVMEHRQIQARIDDERERRRHAEDIAYELARARSPTTTVDTSDRPA